jgi:hypothetical protein
MPSCSLSTSDLTLCRRLYEAGQTFGEIGQRYGVAERTMRRLLRSVGVEPRPRGTVPAAIPPIVLEDARAGLSAHQIAAKHRLPRYRVNALLRVHGLTRAPRQRVLEPLGAKVTNRQAFLRRRPPLVIPLRTPAERRVKAWTAAELGAIEYEIAAGRFKVIARGVSGRREDDKPWWAGPTFEFCIAMQRVRAAA